MKIVIGLFTPEDVTTAVRRLTDHGFNYDDISLMSSRSEMPAYLEGDPEESAASGAAVGAAAGGAVGALSTWAVSAVPGFETMFVSGLMATAVGSVIGGYLGSMYAARGETQTKLDIDEALADGNILLVVRVEKANAATAVTQMKQSQGEHIETHSIPDTEMDNQA